MLLKAFAALAVLLIFLSFFVDQAEYRGIAVALALGSTAAAFACLSALIDEIRRSHKRSSARKQASAAPPLGDEVAP